MGYQTDFIGYLQIDPSLGEREQLLVNRVSGSLYLPPEEAGLRIANEDDAVLRELANGAPRGWSNWTVCPEGCCLSYDGGDKANHMIPWLRFLIDTLLKPGATAEGLEGLTCDHVLNGMVVGSRRDNRELYSITVRDNEVEVELLWPGSPQWSTYQPLRYQEQIDRFREWVVEKKAGGDWPLDW